MGFGRASFVWGSQDFVAVATYSKAGFVTSENRPGESTGTRQRPGCRAAKQCRSFIFKVKRVFTSQGEVSDSGVVFTSSGRWPAFD
jgi:hypothetical protein